MRVRNWQKWAGVMGAAAMAAFVAPNVAIIAEDPTHEVTQDDMVDACPDGHVVVTPTMLKREGLYPVVGPDATCMSEEDWATFEGRVLRVSRD